LVVLTLCLLLDAIEFIRAEDTEAFTEVVTEISVSTTALEGTTVFFFDLDGLGIGSVTFSICSSLLGTNGIDSKVVVGNFSLECALDFVVEDFTRSTGDFSFSLDKLCDSSIHSEGDLFLTIGLIKL
jgi:hypothetical protein